MAASRLAIQSYFRNVKDPRRCPQHLLIDVIVIAICTILCGAQDWQQIVTFGQQRRSWLQRFLTLPNGIPCHDSFERVFAGEAGGSGEPRGEAIIGSRATWP